jgi:hypothetical protein
MAHQPASPAEREQVLDEVLTAYLKAVDAGQPPDRRALLARHPELAADLERFFADHDAISRWTEPLRRPDLDTPAEGAGDRPGLPLGWFGDYELLGVLGRGEMGGLQGPAAVAEPPGGPEGDPRRRASQVRGRPVLPHRGGGTPRDQAWGGRGGTGPGSGTSGEVRR